MPQFKQGGSVNIKPNSILTRRFAINPSTTATSNNGYIPYGSNVSAVDLIVYDKDDVDVTSEIINEVPALMNNIVTVVFKYPAESQTGRYLANFNITIDNGDTDTLQFHRIYVTD